MITTADRRAAIMIMRKVVVGGGMNHVIKEVAHRDDQIAMITSEGLPECGTPGLPAAPRLAALRGQPGTGVPAWLPG